MPGCQDRLEKVEILRLTYRGGKATPRSVKCLQGPPGNVEHTYGGRWFWEPCRSVEHTYAPASHTDALSIQTDVCDATDDTKTQV